MTDYREDQVVVGSMVDALVVAATGKQDLAAAWKSMVKPEDKVGIKVSAAGGRYFSTHQGIVKAVVLGLEQAGVSRANIIVWDRADMGVAGYREGDSGYKVQSILPGIGYDLKSVFVSPVLGKLIWGDLQFAKAHGKLISEESNLSSESHWSHVVSQQVTKIINLPVMSSREDCGLAGALYNVTIPNIDNWRRFVQPPACGDPYIDELYADPRIAPKVVLHIMDGLVAQFAGGPEFQPNYSLGHNTIYASKDPVAMDAVALKQIQGWRSEANLPALGMRGDYVKSAAQMGLGNCLPEHIELKPVTK